MKNFRNYGESPYNVVVVHGGPGIPGDAAPLARELSKEHGILEPLLSEESIEGQIEELKSIAEKKGNTPIYLIGHSWGAWLDLLFTAEYPNYVKKLIMIGSGPLETEYVDDIMKTRLERLKENEKEEFEEEIRKLQEYSKPNKRPNRLKDLMSKTDCYDPLDHDDEVIEFQPEVHRRVWKEAERLRREDELIEFMKKIDCPVLAIHGDYDPHPYEGVKEPISRELKAFEFVLLEDCGHYPWYEKNTREEFFEILEGALGE